jgi:hypothetical protein
VGFEPVKCGMVRVQPKDIRSRRFEETPIVHASVSGGIEILLGFFWTYEYLSRNIDIEEAIMREGIRSLLAGGNVFAEETCSRSEEHMD